MNNYALATKNKFRWTIAGRIVSLEDLWDLPLTKVKVAANDANKKIKASDDLFAVVDKDTQMEQIKLDVLVDVVKTREAEIQAKVGRKEKAEKVKYLKDLIAKKAHEKQEGQSIEELEKALAEAEEEL